LGKDLKRSAFDQETVFTEIRPSEGEFMVTVHEIRSEEQMATATKAGLSLEAGAGMLEASGAMGSLVNMTSTRGEVGVVH